MSVGRVLPHSLEAEEHLLSSIFIDGPDVLTRAEAAGITADSLYDPKHGIVYAGMRRLMAAGVEISPGTLAEELKTARELDQVGGYAFLTQVSGRVPTTAQAGYFIEKVVEQATLRAAIRTATAIVEDCYTFSGGTVEDHIGRMVSDLANTVSGQVSAKEKKWGERKWTFAVYNTYNRRNPFYMDVGVVYDGPSKPPRAVFMQYSLFPVIPSVAYSFKF